MRQFNEVLVRWMEVKERSVPHAVWRPVLDGLQIPGPVIQPPDLGLVTQYFAPMNRRLAAAHPGLADLDSGEPGAPVRWQEPDPEFGFRTTQYLAAYHYRLRTGSKPLADLAREQQLVRAFSDKVGDFVTVPPAQNGDASLSRREFLDLLDSKHRMILGSAFRPHDRVGSVL